MKKNTILVLLLVSFGLNANAYGTKNYTLEQNNNNANAKSSISFTAKGQTVTQEYDTVNPSKRAPIIIKRTSPKKSGTSEVTGFTGSFCQGFNSGIFGDSDNSSSLTLAGAFDPYFVEIDGVKYMLIKDNNDGVFDENDILGINDSQSNIFASLRPLDTNKDSKLTGDELTKAGVRLVRVNSDGKLDYKNKENDYKNSNIEFIYLTELRKAYKNDGSTGQFGQYDVVIKNNKGEKSLVTGLVTFETEEEVKKYF